MIWTTGQLLIMGGTYWFERMKNDGGKDAILRGVKGIVGGS